MKRAIFTLVLLSCGPQPSLTQDAGFTGNMSLTPGDPWILAVRGSSVTTHAVLSVLGDPGSVTVAFSALPIGLTASPASWSVADSPSVPLTLTADADAPEMELNVDVRASVNGTVLASAVVHLTVSGVVGSIDPTFASSGRALLQANISEPTRIGRTSDGDFIVAGRTTSAQVCAERVLTDGTSPGFVTGGSNAQYASASAISDTGLVAVAAVQTGTSSIVEFDAIQGQVVSTVDNVVPITAMSLDGTSLFYASTTQLVYDATGKDAATSLSITSLETLAPGVALAGGLDQKNGGTALVTFTASSTDVSASIAHAIPGPYSRVTNTITSGGTTFVGLSSASGDVAVARVDAQGDVLDVRALPSGEQWANVRIALLPNGEPVLLGTRVIASGSSAATLGVVQSFTTDFGVLGRAFVRLDGPTTIIDGIADATGAYLYVTGETGNTLHPYIARIRLNP